MPREDTQFKPGWEGGPGRPPTRIPTFFRNLAEADDPAEVDRLIASGMRNPLIAAKLRAVQCDDIAESNRSTEQILDRVFGKPTQRTEHAGQVDLRALMLNDTGEALSE